MNDETTIQSDEAPKPTRRTKGESPAPIGVIAQLTAESMELSRSGRVQEEGHLSNVLAKLHALRLAIADVDHDALTPIKQLL